MPDPIPKPFFRADHVGSLLRPERVQAARKALAAGTLDRTGLRAVENDALTGMVRRQEAVGLKAVTDGEVRRQNWWIDFIRAIPGVAIEKPVEADSFAAGSGGAVYVPLDVAVRDRIAWAAPVMADDFRDLAARTTATPKITIPAPSRIHFHSGDAVADPAVYPDIDAFWEEVVGFYRAEIRALEEAGCRYIQIDDPIMSYFVDEAHLGRMRERGMDPDATLARYVDVINRSIAERSPETCLALHICRGNARSTWAASGGYARIAEIVFPELRVDTLFLEFDDERSGDFAPLARLADQRVALGLITSKRPQLEDRSLILRRIEEASRLVPLDRLALSPQCGFASSEEGNLLSEEDQWRKLAHVVDIAAEVWGEP